MAEKRQRELPFEEHGQQAQRRVADLPDQPQQRLIRGYGALNPEEGPKDEGNGE